MKDNRGSCHSAVKWLSHLRKQLPRGWICWIWFGKKGKIQMLDAL